IMLEADSLPDKKAKVDSGICAPKDKPCPEVDSAQCLYKDKPCPAAADKDSVKTVVQATKDKGGPADSSAYATKDEPGKARNTPGETETAKTETPEIKAKKDALNAEAPNILGREKLNFIEQVSETWYAFPHQFKEVVKGAKNYTD